MSAVWRILKTCFIREPRKEKSITIVFRHQYSHLFLQCESSEEGNQQSLLFPWGFVFKRFSFESAFARMIHIHPYGCNISWGWKPEQSIKERLIYQDFFFEDNSNIQRAFFRVKNTGLHSWYSIDFSTCSNCFPNFVTTMKRFFILPALIKHIPKKKSLAARVLPWF